MLRQAYILLSGLLLFLSACEKPAPETEATPQAELFVPAVPANLPGPVASPARNPLTKQGILLGRKLFYDPVLSGSNKISCATCHNPQKAFSDGVALTTKGASGNKLLRHTPAIINIAWMNRTFWDGGAKDLESLNFGPIKHPDEMNQDLNELVAELKQHPEYPKLFKEAFPQEQEIASALVSRALAQFQRTLISADSKYDKYIRKEAGGTLTALEMEGLHLYRQHCSSCHATDLFTDNSYHNNGLDNSYSTDHEEIAFGRGRITQKQEDIGKFKTPTLRNVALTAPYMHDGRFATLEEVLNHYSSGIKPSATLAPQLQNGITLTEAEQQKIILFLHTLTDNTFVTNPAFSKPE